MPISSDVQSKLVDTLFAQKSSIVAGAVGTFGVGLLAYIRGGETWLQAWLLATLLITAGRLHLMKLYRCRPASDDPMKWANRFTYGAAASGFLWGVASATTVLHGDAFEQFVIVTAQSAYITGGSVRNNAVPRAGLFQIVPPLGLLLAACLIKDDIYYRFYSLFVVLHLAAALHIMFFLSGRTRDLLVAEECAAQANARLEMLATTDGLTGIVNRRGFDSALQKECARAVREHQPISLLILDIDHFKALNDAFGHPAGDACLNVVARCLQDSVRRPADLVARYGGEEFAVLLPNTDAAGASQIAEGVRLAVMALGVRHPSSPSGAVTTSVGYATLRPGSARESGVLVAWADKALYEAKRSGRNRSLGRQEDRIDAGGRPQAALAVL